MRLVGLIAAKDNNAYSTNPNAVTVTVLLFVVSRSPLLSEIAFNI